MPLSYIKTLGNALLNFDDLRLHALVGKNGSGKTSVLKDIESNHLVLYHNLDATGVLLAVRLASLIPNLDPPGLILLDNIENGLHPANQRQLIKELKESLQANSNLQVIFWTHSPYVVDELAFAQVHILNNTAKEGIKCKRLDDHPDAEWAKHALTTGEFWDSVGEDWVD